MCIRDYNTSGDRGCSLPIFGGVVIVKNVETQRTGIYITSTNYGII